MNNPRPLFRIVIVTTLLLVLGGCAGALIETTTDAALAVAKAPFKAGGAIVDVVTGDDDD